jgi:hypothetical protein
MLEGWKVYDELTVRCNNPDQPARGIEVLITLDSKVGFTPLAHGWVTEK